MENYDMLLNLVENPDKYSPMEIREILSNPERKEIYEILCKISSALNSNDRISDEFIDTEWLRLNSENSVDLKSRKPFFRHWILPSSRIASFAVIILSSVVALAVGIAVTISVVDKKTEVNQVVKPLANAKRTATFSDTVIMSPEDRATEVYPVIFEDTSLEEILKAVSKHYDVSVEFKSQESAGIHLFYKLDTRQPLDDIIEQLNTFDRIDISKEENILIVE